MNRKLLSFFICVVMLMAMMPAAVFAASGTETDPIPVTLGETTQLNCKQETYSFCSFTPAEDGAYTILTSEQGGLANDSQPLYGYSYASGFLESGNTYVFRIHSQTEWVQVIDEGRYYTGLKDDNNIQTYFIWDFDPGTGTLTIDPGKGGGEMNPNQGDRYLFPWYSAEDRIKHVIIGEGVTSISPHTFDTAHSFYEPGDKYAALEDVSFPSTLRRIGKYAFRKSPKLKTVSFPASLEAIEEDAFFYCKDLESATFDGATDVGYGAFDGCTALEDVTINNSGMTDFGPFAFFNTPWIRILAAENKGAAIVNNVLIGAYQAWDKEPGDGILIIPDGVTKISEAALHGTSIYSAGGEEDFQNVWYLEEVVIPDSVKTIEVGEQGFGAFALCDQLERVTIGDGLTTIPSNCFEECGELRTVNFGKNVTTIGDYAFDNCWLPGELVIPETVTSIGKWAFRLESVKGGWDWIKTDLDSPDKVYQEKDFSDQSIFLGAAVTSIEHGYWDSFKGWDKENVPIKGYDGTYAEQWAKDNGFTFESLGPAPASFVDVPANAYYAEAVGWAVRNGITSGTDSSHFSPDAGCTRAQAVTFLWRAAGEPEPKTTSNPFLDVKEGTFYHKAVLWAVENKVTDGTSATTFSPDATCTRAQIVTFLCRFKGEPAPTTDVNPFTDVKAGAYYEKAVLWASETGITKGTSATLFSPDATCTRGQVVTFLYRAEKN